MHDFARVSQWETATANLVSMEQPVTKATKKTNSPAIALAATAAKRANKVRFIRFAQCLVSS